MHVYTLIYNSCDRWKDGELKKTIEMLRRPEFDSKEVDPDLQILHKRMQKADSSQAHLCNRSQP